MTLRTPLLLLGAVLVAATTLAVPASGAPVVPPVLILGDSLTARGTDDLRAVVTGWNIEGVIGRPIASLPYRIAAHHEAGPLPRTVVVAYGSNASPGYGAPELSRDLAMLPTSTRVVLVTPYRVPSTYRAGEPAYRDPTLINAYAAIMRGVAKQRPNTCIAPWAAYARNHPERLIWKYGGGVHPDSIGQKVWARIIVDAVRACR